VLPSSPLPAPPPPAAVSSATVATGLLIPAIDRIKIFSDTQWEEFILEWADSLSGVYQRVDRCGGAGDKGRDVIGVCPDGVTWDNYQCKHYAQSLKPTGIWIELAKLAYYTHLGEYTCPRRYVFVAPQGAGTTLSNLLKKPQELRTGLIDNWDKYCRKSITTKSDVPLDGSLLKHVQALDFKMFEAAPVLRIIDQHAKTRWHVARFGGGLPARPAPASPPTQPANSEAVYVRHLLDAYADHVGRGVSSPPDLQSEPELHEHFGDCRLEFYSAE
jgi:hypothetical protein